ncbi:MAG: flavin monoamine oxidase family protein [Bradymonadia bacterium]
MGIHSRREAMETLFKLLTASTLGLGGLSACTKQPKPSSIDASAPAQRSVVVIGAGLAGLTAAKALQNAGQKVVVLEGRARIGGRTHTASVGAAKIDLGAAWIHGPDDNPLAVLCRAAGLKMPPQEIDPSVIYDDALGRALTEDEAAAVVEAVEGFFEAETTEALAESERTSLAQALRAYVNELELSPALRALVLHTLTTFTGDSGPSEQVSLHWLFHSASNELSGGDVTIEGGYLELVKFLAEGVDVRTEHVVTRVKTTGDTVTVDTKTDSITADHVIVTVPLGVLKSGSIKFEPALSPGKRAAIERLQMNTMEKVVLTFSERFWPAEIGSVLHRGDAGRDCPLLIDMTEHAGATTWVGLCTGPSAAEMQKTTSDGPIIDRTLRALRAILGRSVPTPAATYVTRWWSDPFAHGAYSLTAVGASPKDRTALAEPMGPVLFAGEATMEEMFATAHGAVMSGLREAKRIVNQAKLPG